MAETTGTLASPAADIMDIDGATDAAQEAGNNDVTGSVAETHSRFLQDRLAWKNKCRRR